MGLDAVVFCDCVEKGRLRIPHPWPHLLYIFKNGRPEIRSQNEDKIDLHDDWMEGDPCKHSELMVAGCYLGNIAFIDFIREAVCRVAKVPARDFPVVWNKVIYNGCHTCDYLKLPQVRKLKEEVRRLRAIDFAEAGLKARDVKDVKDFLANLAKLVKASLRIQKPIAF